MVIMTHIGDPETWYAGKYGRRRRLAAKYGTREEHYRMWEGLLEEYRGTPWLGAHLGGNPEDLPRLQRLLDTLPRPVAGLQRHPLDGARDQPAATRRGSSSSATRTASCSAPTRSAATTAASTSSPAGSGATASCGRPPTPAPARYLDPDLPPDRQPMLNGLALPDDVLQKIYHDNPVRFLAGVGIHMGEGD